VAFRTVPEILQAYIVIPEQFARQEGRPIF